MDPRESPKFQQAEQHTRLASSALDQRNVTKALHNCKKAYEIYKELELLEELLFISSNMVNLYLHLNKIKEAQEILEELKPLTKGMDLTFELGLLHGMFGRLYLRKEMLDEALDETSKQTEIFKHLKKTGLDVKHFMIFVKMFTEAQKQLMMIRSQIRLSKRGTLSQAQQNADELIGKSQEYVQMGNLPLAVKMLDEAIKVYIEHEDNLRAVDVISSMIPYLIVSRQLKEAQDYASKALEIAKKIKDNYSLFSAHKALGEVQSKIGVLSEAIDNLNKALEYGEKIKGLDVLSLSSTYFSLGHAYMLDQRQKEAIDFLSKAGETADPQLNPLIIAKSHLFIGECYFATLNFEKAVEELEKSTKMLESIQQFPDLIMNLDFLGKSYENIGKLDKAIEAFEKGIKISEEEKIPHRLEHLVISLKYARENLYRLEKENQKETDTDIEKREKIEEKERKLEKLNLKFNLQEYMDVVNSLDYLYKDSIEYQGKAISIVLDKVRIAKLNDEYVHASTGLFRLGQMQFMLTHFDQSKKTFTEAEKFLVRHNTTFYLALIHFYLQVLSSRRSFGPENTYYIDIEKNTTISDKNETAKIYEENKKKRSENYIREDARSCLRVGDIYKSRKKKKIAKRLYNEAKELFTEIDDKEGIAEAENKVNSF